MSAQEKYPNIVVRLTGTDGNIFAIIGRVTKNLRQNKVPQSEISEFSNQIMNADSYDHALRIVMQWVQVE